MTAHRLRVALLVVGAGVAVAPEVVAGQTMREQAGVEVALSVGSFPHWTSTPGQGRTLRSRPHPLFGASLAFFPSEYFGVRAAIQTTGIRLASDTGFDTWQLSLEGRFGPLGPVTPFATIGFGSLSETFGDRFQYVTAGVGVRRQLSRSLALSGGINVLLQTGAASRGGQSTEIDLDPLTWRLGISWRPIRFGN